MLRTPITRIKYDVKNPEHLKALETFLLEGRWTIYFEIESGVTNLPYRLMERTLLHLMKNNKQDEQTI